MAQLSNLPLTVRSIPLRSKRLPQARTFKEAQIVDPWEVEVVFGDNGGGILGSSDCSRYRKPVAASELPIKVPGDDNLPRGELFTEMIDNYLFEVLGPQAVDPNQKAATTWGHLKSKF